MNLKKDIGMYIILTVALVLTIAILSIVADTNTTSTTKTVVTNETLNIASARAANSSLVTNITFYPEHTASNTGWRANVNGECDVNTIVFTKSNGSVLTANTDYVYSPISGNITMKDTPTTADGKSNSTRLNYQYCADTYVPGATNQNILGLIVLFGAIAILIWAITYLIKNGGIYSLASKVRETVGIPAG